MNLIDFIKGFPDETSCKSKFKEYRDKEVLYAPNVGARNIIGSGTRKTMSVNVWLSSEFEGQHGDAQQSVAVSLLVCGHSSADLD
jgi:hypothetical protein